MRRVAAGITVTLLLLAVVAQFALPAFVADRIEHRLEEGGGRATVKLKAVPALGLLLRSGELLEVEGEGLQFDIRDYPGDPFAVLDGFDRVDLSFTDSTVDPLQVKRFALVREDPDIAYKLALSGTSTPAALGQAIGPAGGVIGGLLGELGADVLPGGAGPGVPVNLTATIRSVEGRAKILDVTGSVAGFPVGPLAEFVIGAVLASF